MYAAPILEFERNINNGALNNMVLLFLLSLTKAVLKSRWNEVNTV